MTNPMATELVTRTTPCWGCRYDLRGLATEGKCPECGMAVVESTRRDWLLRAPIEARRRVRLGLGLSAWAPWGMIVGVAATSVVGSMATLPTTQTASRNLSVIPWLFAVGVPAALLVSWLAFCYGVWLTARGALMAEAGDDSRPIFRAAESLAVILGLVVVGAVGTGTILAYSGELNMRVSDAVLAAAMVFFGLWPLLFMVTALLHALVVGHLGEAALDRVLAKRARRLAPWSVFLLTAGLLMCFSGGLVWALANALVSMRLRKAIPV